MSARRHIDARRPSTSDRLIGSLGKRETYCVSGTIMAVAAREVSDIHWVSRYVWQIQLQYVLRKRHEQVHPLAPLLV